MIVLDIETSGVDFNKCGIIQIGALEIGSPENIFVESARLAEEYEVVQSVASVESKTVEEVTGMTEKQMRGEKLQTEKELLESFFKWIEEIKNKDLICDNPQFDYSFIKVKADKYGLKLPFSYRCMDLHTVAQIRYFDLKKSFLIKDDYSDMGLKNILELCGMVDNRKGHDALEDARMETECFSRLVYGKNLIKEYKDISVPDILKR